MPNLFGSRLPFDFIGAFLMSVAMVSLTLTFELINEGINLGIPIFLFVLAIFFLLIYRFYAHYAKFAIFPLALFELHTFRIGLMGNLISRLGISAMPFLVILLLQVAFGYSPIMAGLIFVPMAMASVIMKRLAQQPILKKFGYRYVLFYNTFIVGLIIISLSFLNPLSPIIIIIIQLFILGFVSSLQFTSMNSIALADLEGGLISSGNSLVTINQQLAISFGIAFAAMLLRMFSDTVGQVSHNIDYAFKITFIIFGLITCLSSLIFNRLHPEDGYNLITRIKKSINQEDKMQYKIIPVTSFAQNCTIIWCDKTRKAAMVDPGGEAKRLINVLGELEVEVDKILITHGHLDHVGAAKELADHFSAEIYGPSQEDNFWLNNLPQQSTQFGLLLCLSFEPDYWLKEGDKIDIGEESLDVLHCAGHTPGHIVFIHQRAKLALVGDVLFHGSVGRTDFPMGSLPNLMYAIKQKLLPLGDDFCFIPGHGPMSTFGHERQHNPYLQSHG